MDVRRVKPDSDDYSMAIPSAILPGLNADFDGDILNTLGIEMPEFVEFFAGFRPVEMITNRVTGELRYNISALENITIAILSDKAA